MARKNDILSIYTKEVEQIKADGLFKGEAPFVSPQGAKVVMEDGRELLNMCANNYLGLGDNQRLIDAAKRTYDEKGYGVASVRFICGTQDIHKKLEKKISGFLGTDDTILYSSCFDANGGLFETILTAEDAVISDELNHASIIDGVRLCKAKRYRYKNNNMEDLEAQLQAADAAGARVKLIATDGVFSMDGIICNLKGVCDLADKYNALVMVDDSHAVGFVGAHGRGTSEYCGVEGRVDIITGTLVGQQLTSTGVSEDGQWVEVPAMSIKREYDFPEVGMKDMYLLHHEEIESLAKNIPGVKRIRFFMTFGQSYLTHMKCLENVGMLRTDPVKVGNVEVVPIQLLKELLPDPASLGERTVGKTNIGCIFTGKKDGKEKKIYIYNVCDHQECYKEVESQAISYTTGVPAMIGAMMVVTGKWNKPGVYNVEEFDPDPYMEALNKWGLPWVVEENPVLVK